MRSAIVVSMVLTTGRVAGLEGLSIAPPGCANRCMIDSMYITQCQDIDCLCHEDHFQKSLFQCLYSQCDSPDYGSALLHSMKTCMATGAEIQMMGLPTVTEQLNSREDDYLAGRELQDIPGLQLRQDSAGPNVATVWQTTTVFATTTMTAPLPVSIVTPFPGASGRGPAVQQGPGPMTSFFDTNNTQAQPTRPWMVTVSETGRHRPSYLALLLWTAGLLVLDYAHGNQ